MDKETMINILNQHGLDVLYDVISDEIRDAYDTGYEHGQPIGWCECYDMMSEDD